ncbi:hypothetical protein KN1_16680 [Stygiolobus caldivivus]|uniref:Uncharacterized protein n=2 Tax=Stygiolobus caldivivus TaxID=2824673 RepID=A0A8D5U7S5_9CREN|nr:hypothetical protein KN1_16680 [Stygiolobus caldivivus]
MTSTAYQYPGFISYDAEAKVLYLLLKVYPSGNLNSLYMNVTIEFQFVTPQQTVDLNVTAPVVVSALAVTVMVYPPESKRANCQCNQRHYRKLLLKLRLCSGVGTEDGNRRREVN